MGRLRERIEVDAYSGFRANERPKSLRVAGGRVEVEEVIDRWYGERYDYFKVRGSDGRRYTIRYDRREDEWEMEGCEGA